MYITVIKVARNFKKIQFTFTIQLYTVYKCYIKDPDVITYSYSIAAVVGCSVIQKHCRKSLVCFRWRPKKIKKTTKQKGNLENQKMYDGMVLPRLMGLYQMPSALASLILLPFRAPSSHSVQEKCVSCCPVRLICDKKQQTYLFCCQFGKGKKFLWPETELTL